MVLKFQSIILNNQTGEKDSLQNLSGKLNRDTLKFREADGILNALGYEFTITPGKEG